MTEIKDKSKEPCGATSDKNLNAKKDDSIDKLKLDDKEILIGQDIEDQIAEQA